MTTSHSNFDNNNTYKNKTFGGDDQDQFKEYYALSDYQKQCLPTTNYWRVQNGLPEILVPPMEYYDWDYQDLINHLGKEKALEKVQIYTTEKGVKDATCIKEGLLLKTYQQHQLPTNENSILETKISVFYDKVDDKQLGIKNIKVHKDLSVLSVAKLIQSDRFKDRTEVLRSLTDTKENKAYKQKYFCYACFSGTFSVREDKALIKHSKLICIDLDKIDDVDRVKTIIDQEADRAHYIMCFTSPNGNGLKPVFYANDLSVETQYEYYQAFSAYLTELCTLPEQIIDKSCKDISRACFLPWDQDLVINKDLFNGNHHEV